MAIPESPKGGRSVPNYSFIQSVIWKLGAQIKKGQVSIFASQSKVVNELSGHVKMLKLKKNMEKTTAYLNVDKWFKSII